MGVAWKDWSDAIAAGVRGVSDEMLHGAAWALATSRLILVAGNGGSAALASHAAQALLKPAYEAGGALPAVCINDMVPTLTAHANDGGWDNALVKIAWPFLERVAVKKTTLLLFSSSGRSENIVRLARIGGRENCEIIAMTGFDGAPLRQLATMSLHVNSHDYEVVEPVHDALLHRMQYHVRELLRAEEP